MKRDRVEPAKERRLPGKKRVFMTAVMAAGLIAVMAAAVLSPLQGRISGVQVEAANGNVINGGEWVPVEGVPNAWYYVTADGVHHSDCFSFDSYYVEADGRRLLSKSILNTELPMRNSWLTANEAASFDCFVPAAANVQRTLASVLKKYRTLTVYNTHMMLSSVNNTQNGTYMADRLGLYKNSDINGYTIMVATSIIGDRKVGSAAVGDVDLIAYYDYEVLRFFTNSVSRNGDLLAGAIYSHWMDVNEQGIRLGEWVRVGDTMVRYMPGSGQGLYEIKAAF